MRARSRRDLEGYASPLKDRASPYVRSLRLGRCMGIRANSNSTAAVTLEERTQAPGATNATSAGSGGDKYSGVSMLHYAP